MPDQRTTTPLRNQRYRHGNQAFIEVRRLVKVYKTPAGDFPALKSIDLQVNQGEFVAVIGKSGSGKSTFINMLTGIDRPTSGEIFIGDAAIHTFNEDQMAEWRGQNLGIVFQFFQLIPTLTLVENVMLPMDINALYTPAERRERGMYLLEMVEMAEQARKLPAAVSGGQQQRVAIARALANNPQLIVADEPTGNLDSRTAEKIFQLFEHLVADGKTIIMVTHDDALAKRVQRTVMIFDGEVVNEYLVQALATLNHDQLVEVRRKVEPVTYAPGATIVRQGEVGDKFYIITAGQADVFLDQSDGKQVLVNTLHEGHYFGEMALVRQEPRQATVRAAADNALTVVALDRDSFNEVVSESRSLREELNRFISLRSVEAQVQMLSHLPRSELLEMTRDLAVKTVAAGESIVRQGALGETFFIILDGEADVLLEHPDGSQQLIDHLESGQYFGEMALLGDRRRRATVRAWLRGPTRVVELSLDDFDRLKVLSDRFTTQLAELTAERETRLEPTPVEDGRGD